MFKQWGTINRIFKKDELCTAVVSVAGHRYQVKHMRKEDTLRIYNWYKEKGNTGV